MIFRRYTSFIIIISLICLGSTLFAFVPYLKTPNTFKGGAQPGVGSYPLQSSDRQLIDLNGDWSAFPGLSWVNLQPTGTVQNKVYAVGVQVYGGEASGKSVFVPGTWNSKVVTKQFFLSNELSSRAFRLHFLGSAGVAEVYINGTSPAEFIGTVPGNQVPTYLNIPTPKLKFGEINTIVVRLNPPEASGSWYPFPGLTGEVYLEALGSIVIGNPQVDTRLSPEGADLTFQLPVASKLAKDEVVNTQVNLVDAYGNSIAGSTQSVKVNESGKAVLSGSLQIPQAHYWSPADPYLYKLEVSVSSERGERDSYVFPLGLREASFVGNKMLANGQEFALKVVQRVNDTAESGGAGNASALENDLKKAKELGFNTLLIPDHSPQPYLFDLADRYGMFILAQSPVIGVPTTESGDAAGQAMETFGYHASFLAQGLGTSLDLQNPSVQEYITRAEKNHRVFYSALGNPELFIFNTNSRLELKAPYLADFLSTQPSYQVGKVKTQVNPVGILTRERTPKQEQQGERATPYIPMATPFALAAVTVVLILQSARIGNLRFLQLEGKLKRKIRSQVKLQFFWFVQRHCLIALLLVQSIASLEAQGAFGFWLQFISNYSLNIFVRYLLLAPWALFCVMFVCGLILSLVLAWPRAKSLPTKLSALGLVLWLEKRKRWAVLALGAWIYSFYGGPFWLVWPVMLLGFIISVFSTSQDIKRVGGKTFNVLYLAVTGVIIILVVGFNWNLVELVYHWYQLYRG